MRYVILGHSERRAYFGETDQIVNRKLISAQAFDLTPIVCVGETLDQYESKLTREVVSAQTSLSLRDVSPAYAPRIVVAYEPVWAIGTGKASNGEEANAVVKMSSAPLAELFGMKLRKLFVCYTEVQSPPPTRQSSWSARYRRRTCRRSKPENR
jgi:triosephosphate isomerase